MRVGFTATGAPVVLLSGCAGGSAVPTTTTKLPTTTATAPPASTATAAPVLVTWARVPHDEVICGGSGDQRMQWVVLTAAGLVAAGYDDSGGDADVAVWAAPFG